MRIVATSSLIAVGLMLTGCGSSSSLTDNRGVESVHQPVIQRTDYVLDVNTSGGGLAQGEAARIRGWFDALHVAYGDKIAVDTGESGNDSFARAAVAKVAGQHGLALQPHAPMTAGALAPGSVRVIVSRTTATVPGCPDFKESVGSKFNATVSQNYGCATNATMAAMLADPEDLVRGRSGKVEGATTVNANAVATYQSTISQKAGTVTAESTK